MEIRKNSQITIFVIIGVILILGFLFVVTSLSVDETNQFNTLKEDSLTQEFNIYNLYEASQACLELATKKAVLLTSVRGGLIYPRENSITFQTSLNSLDLSSVYLRNLNLNPNLIQQFMNPGLTYENYLSALNRDIIIDEISHYVTRDFIGCQLQSFNSTEFSDLSYTELNLDSRRAHGENYSYEIEKLKEINSSVVKIYRDDGTLAQGKLIENRSRVLTNIFFEDNEIVYAVLPKEAFRIKIEAENFRVLSRIETIDSFQASSTTVDRGEIRAEVSTPLFSLIDDLRVIFQAKVEDRRFSFIDESDINDLIQSSPIFINNFKIQVNNLTYNEEEVFQEIIITSLEPRNFEFDSLVSLYRNTAPIIRNNNLILISDTTGPNSFLDSNYLGGIEHNEFEDNFLLQGREFRSFEDNVIKLYPDGRFELKTNSGFHSYIFYVTDGELSTPFEVNFNLGGNINENNRDVNNCFEVIYNLGDLDPSYDNINEFVTVGTRKLNLRSSVNNGVHSWYGVVAAGQSNSVNVQVIPKSSCFTSSPPAIQSFSLSNGQTRDVKISHQDMSSSFELTIGATDCLGPPPIHINTGDLMGSCCNFNRILSLINANSYNQLISENFILESGTVAVDDDEDLYMCVERPRASQSSHWNNLDFLKTQIITTNLRVICQGVSPVLQENLIETSGNTLLGTFRPIDFPLINVDLRYTSSSNFHPLCKECSLHDPEEAYLLQDPSGGRVSIGFEPTTQAARDGIDLGDVDTRMEIINGQCFNIDYRRECLQGAPTWVEKSRTPC
ncbi:MAG: hypothetical protein ACMXYB_04645 [Candidatus Woesearchaeota archaeon]